jgi:hypothetical protein
MTWKELGHKGEIGRHQLSAVLETVESVMLGRIMVLLRKRSL